MLKLTGRISFQGHCTTWRYRAVDMSDNLQPEVPGASREKLQPPDFKWTVLKVSFYISSGYSQVLMVVTKAVIHSSLSFFSALFPPCLHYCFP